MKIVDKDFDIEIGKNLRELRLQQAKTLNEVAQKLGVTYQQIYKYESGQNSVSLYAALKFCDIYKVSLSQLYNKSK